MSWMDAEDFGGIDGMRIETKNSIGWEPIEGSVVGLLKHPDTIHPGRDAGRDRVP